jgi:hypothetical protein
MQLFHHSVVIGGSWNSPSKQLEFILGFDADEKPVQIVQKSINDIKVKSHSREEIALGLETLELFEQLKTKKWNYIIKTSYPSHIY